MSRARSFINQHMPRPVSVRTKAEYVREVRRLLERCPESNLGALLRVAADTQSKLTYRRRLASIRFLLMQRIKVELREQDQAQRAKDWDTWFDAVGKLQSALSNYAQFIKMRTTCEVTNPIPRGSKRKSLHGLPAEWRDHLWKTMPAKYHLPYLVMALTGCRPAELALGIDVQADSNALLIRISGVKVKEHQGQPSREITYHIDETSPGMVCALHQQVRSAGGTIQVCAPTDAFTSAIRRAGRRLWPGRDSDITPYSLRHAIASDFKRCLSPEDVSSALGHAVSKTASRYGQWQIGRAGGPRPAAVNATRSIRETRSIKPESYSRPTVC